MFHRAFMFPDAAVYFGVFILLIPVNWLLEAVKWRVLLHRIGLSVSFSTALTAVLKGLAVGILTPNRVGEFLGRIMDIHPPLRPRGIMLSVINSLTQLLTTVSAAGIAWVVYRWHFSGIIQMVDEVLLPVGDMLMYAFVFLLFSAVIMYVVSAGKFVSRWGEKFSSLLKTVHQVGAFTVMKVTGLSVLRYLVFLVQYWLILRWFGIVDADWTGWILIPMVFFVTSVIPGLLVFPLDISIRGASAVLFLSPVCADAEAVLFASLMIWCFNLAIPALSGAALMFKKNEPA
ncbi:MAG: flippase-like domain-containing protein [Bacteroidia bacterium]|nr:flippase-like domain-containing protein [Bacteroidia bacterium]